jgi:hypothetical protein
MIITTDNIWFSPINVLYHFARLESLLSSTERKTRSFKKAKEAYRVAIMLMGIIKLQQRQYWLQIIKDEEGSPDIRTGTFVIETGKPKEFTMQEIEVVNFEQHSNENIIDFLKRTKLSPKRPYPSYITFLCDVSKTTLLPPYRQIRDELKSITVKNSVVILGKIHPQKHIYRICQVHPEIDLLTDFDVMEEAYNKKYRGVLSLKLGTDDKLSFIYLPNEKHYPFEALSYKI